jgi:hypothetical protein
MGLFINKFFLLSRESIPHSSVTCYGNRVKKCEDFAPNFGVTTNHHFVPQSYFTKIRRAVVPQSPYSRDWAPSISQIEDTDILKQSK